MGPLRPCRPPGIPPEGFRPRAPAVGPCTWTGAAHRAGQVAWQLKGGKRRKKQLPKGKFAKGAAHMGPKGRKMTGRCARFWWTTNIPYAQHFSKNLKIGVGPATKP